MASGWAQDWTRYNQPLPTGWEAKYDAGSGRYFFINHYNQTTTWVDPRTQQQQQQWQQPQQQQRQQPAAKPQPESIAMNTIKDEGQSSSTRGGTSSGISETTFGHDVDDDAEDDLFPSMLNDDDDIFASQPSMEDRDKIKEKLLKEFPKMDEMLVDMALESTRYNEAETRKLIKEQIAEEERLNPRKTTKPSTATSSKSSTATSSKPATKSTPAKAATPAKPKSSTPAKTTTSSASKTTSSTAKAATGKGKKTEPLKESEKARQEAERIQKEIDRVKRELEQVRGAKTKAEEEAKKSAEDSKDPLARLLGRTGGSMSTSLDKLTDSGDQGGSSALLSQRKNVAQGSSLTTEAKQSRMTKHGYVSGLRTATQGPQASNQRGSDRSLLIKEYQTVNGPDKEHVRGPDPGNVSGAASRTKQSHPKLACGPQHALAKGAQRELARGSMYITTTVSSL